MAFPFPVEVPYRAKPDLTKLGHEPLVIQDPDWAAWCHRKRDAVQAGMAPLIDPQADAALLAQWAGDIAAALRHFAPLGPIGPSGNFSWLGNATPQTPTDFFRLLTQSLQEDFVLMVPDAQQQLRARVLSVCFPSGWLPSEKLGKTLAQIHEPVADAQALQQGTPAMSKAMVEKGPFVRYVWTLAGNGELARAPGEDTLRHVRDLHDLWFRCERQVTVPIEGRMCLFLIRVLVAPLAEVLQAGVANGESADSRLHQLKASLASMSDAVLDYKGLRGVLALL